MGSLTANLKQLYQCRIMWLYHIGFLVPTIPMVLEFAIKSETSLPFPLPPMAMPLTFSFVYGAIMASMVAETLGKPFAFSLPRHFKTARLMLFWIWFFFLSLFSSILMIASSVGAKLSPYTSVSLIGLMSLSFWLGAVILTRARRVLLVFLIAMFFFTGSDIFETILTTAPFALTLACLILSFLILYSIDFKGNARRLCNTPWQNAFVPGAGLSLQTAKYTKRNQPQTDFRWDRFFLNHIRSNVSSMIFSNLWGQLYLLVAPSFRRLISAIPMGVLGLFLVNPFIIQDENPQFIYFIFIFSVSTTVIAIFDNHRYRSFLLISRKAHFFRGATVFFAAILFVTGSLATCIFLFNLISSVCPSVPIMQKTIALTPFPWQLLWVPITLLPILGGLSVFFKKPLQRFFIIVIIIIFYSIIFALANSNMVNGGPRLLFILLGVALAWGSGLSALYYDSLKRSYC